ncbi:MAG: flagellar biosynthesis protein FliQ [Lachnospiraceae bacterium]|jgi:flagellar biosynthetic protein FliQ|nr:flagellar biosynthesis protein FliQ [Lachnospiraceae bacterium]MCI9645899.1 flagellar biosynthesis protein FliQ [Lachnospiraceae bacterium]
MITEGQVMDIAREALYLIIKVSAPLLLISLVIGLIISIFQTVTSIQEQTLTFVPKIIAVFLGMMLVGGWILENIVSFMTELWGNFGLYLR